MALLQWNVSCVLSALDEHSLHPAELLCHVAVCAANVDTVFHAEQVASMQTCCCWRYIPSLL
jgi:hypothetical protein